jgi:hypothetical protein
VLSGELVACGGEDLAPQLVAQALAARLNRSMSRRYGACFWH